MARLDHLLRHVPLPDPWDIDEFLDRLERWRGRAIHLCAVPWTVGDSTGAWQRRADCDVIAYADNTSPTHQDLIILHEIGHMISDHRGRCVLSLDEAQRLAPELAPAAFAHLLDRVATRSEEREAELIATLLWVRTPQYRRAPGTQPVRDERSAATLERLTAAFEP